MKETDAAPHRAGVYSLKDNLEEMSMQVRTTLLLAGILTGVVSVFGCSQESKPEEKASAPAAEPSKPVSAVASEKVSPETAPAAPVSPAASAAPGTPATPAKRAGDLHSSARLGTDEMFKQADTDKNGSLSPEEFKAIQGRMRERPPMPNLRQNLAAFIQRADKDKDQKVTMEEFKVAMPKATDQRFTLMDKNKDGAITVEDAPEGPAGEMGSPMGMLRRSPMQGMLEKADADKDGKLTLEEITAAKPGFPKEAFEKMDANKDGMIESTEFEGLRPPKPEDKEKP